MRFINDPHGQNRIKFDSTGNEVYCYSDVIGLDPSCAIYYGWDGHLGEWRTLEKAEVLELADYMLDKWKELKEKYLNEQKTSG